MEALVTPKIPTRIQIKEKGTNLMDGGVPAGIKMPPGEEG